MSFDTTGMDFALTALFVVLLQEQWKKLHEPFPFAAGLVTGITALALWPQHMPLVSIGLSILILLTRYRPGESTS
ncbi:hypothetical protein [Solemya velesiana gill symbiont]|uniref:hypothetical protein n=1 Tax=Solemya velesiana gill symbiont TaxID=1918948 RepID=UPI0010831D5F|nr:hypothetical protein [Solemya velesiana gill symbiont]